MKGQEPMKKRLKNIKYDFAGGEAGFYNSLNHNDPTSRPSLISRPAGHP